MSAALPDSEPIDRLERLHAQNAYVFVMGPGEGEAVAVAFPDEGGWLLVDGCRSGDGTSGLVAVLEKWRRADEPVHAYALTHPHTDHARGIVELVEVYGPAIRVVAVTPPWAAPPGSAQITSKRIVATQVRRGLEALEKLCSKGARKVDLVAGCSLAISTARVAVSIHCPTRTELKKGGDPNELSAVIEITHGEARIVLGSDLPTTTRGGGGWRRLLRRHPEIAEHTLLKVPHHGSSTSHHSPLFVRHQRTRSWTVTPFNTHDLPELVEMNGLRWILERGEPVHLTAPPVSKHVQLPVSHPGVIPVRTLRSRILERRTGNPLLDSGATETTPRALNSNDSIWCFAVNDQGIVSGRWRGSVALEVVR